MMRVVLIISMFLSLTAAAQQEAMYTHYSFNTLGINPAYAGSREALTVTALHRSQWISFPGAPITQTVNIHTPLAKENIGLGASFVNDRLGPTNTSGFFLDFAYRLKTGDKSRLSFALKGGMKIRGTKFDELTQAEAGDPTFQTGGQSDILPNVGFGLYFQHSNFYAGISAPTIIQNSFEESSVSTNVGLSEVRHYYFIAGGLLNLSKSGNVKLRPSTFVKLAPNTPIQFDVTALLYLNDIVYFGPMFRSNDAAGLLAGVFITKQFNIGYSFDFSYANSTGQYNNGSHEIMLRYDFIFRDKKNIISPRYF